MGGGGYFSLNNIYFKKNTHKKKPFTRNKLCSQKNAFFSRHAMENLFWNWNKPCLNFSSIFSHEKPKLSGWKKKVKQKESLIQVIGVFFIHKTCISYFCIFKSNKNWADFSTSVFFFFTFFFQPEDFKFFMWIYVAKIRQGFFQFKNNFSLASRGKMKENVVL